MLPSSHSHHPSVPRPVSVPSDARATDHDAGNTIIFTMSNGADATSLS